MPNPVPTKRERQLVADWEAVVVYNLNRMFGPFSPKEGAYLNDVMAAVVPAMERLLAQERERLTKPLTVSNEELRLHCGELTTEQVRLIQSVLRWLRNECDA